MIKVEILDICGLKPAILGMRNPMNSRSRSDSQGTDLYVGPNDLDLMKRLCAAGTEHRKFMRMIVVYMDVTGPLYWLKQLDTFKIGTVSNSCSTMHKLMSKPFELSDFSTDQMNNDGVGVLEHTIRFLNQERDYYINGIHGQLVKDKQFWWNIIQNLPSSYNQKRTLMLNYEVALTMIRQRSNHKLDEWREFVQVLRSLPYMEEFI